MTGLFPDIKFSYLNYITVYMTDRMVCVKTLRIIVTCLNMIFLGGILGSGLKLKNNFSKIHLNNESKDELFKIAKALLILSFPFRLFIDVRTFIAAIAGGYYGAIAVQYSGIVDCIAGFWYSAVILYYLGLNDVKKKKRFLTFTVCYMLLVMLTGNRGHQVVCLIMLFVIVLLENKKIDVKKIIYGIILAYAGLVFIDVIYSMRESGIDYFLKNFVTIVSESLRANILFETIGSFGETIFTPYLVIQGIDTGRITPSFGECFYKSVVSIFPTIGTTMACINSEANFPKMLNTWSAIGGSIVGEMYYNFKAAYGVFACVVGAVLAKISYQITDGLKNKKYTVLLYAIPIFTNLIWWCRDSIGNAVRNIVWICCCIWVMRRIFRNKTSVKQND